MTPFAASGQDGDEWPHGVGSEIDEEVLGLLDVTGVAEQDLWSVAALDAGNELVFPSNPQARPDGVPRANSPSSKSDDEKTSGAETTHWAGDSREDSWQNTSPALSQKEGDVAPAGGQGAPANSSYLARPLARPGGPVQAPAGPRWDAPAEDEQDAVRRERARLSARRMRANHQDVVRELREENEQLLVRNRHLEATLFALASENAQLRARLGAPGGWGCLLPQAPGHVAAAAPFPAVPAQPLATSVGPAPAGDSAGAARKRAHASAGPSSQEGLWAGAAKRIRQGVAVVAAGLAVIGVLTASWGPAAPQAHVGVPRRGLLSLGPGPGEGSSKALVAIPVEDWRAQGLAGFAPRACGGAEGAQTVWLLDVNRDAEASLSDPARSAVEGAKCVAPLLLPGPIVDAAKFLKRRQMYAAAAGAGAWSGDPSRALVPLSWDKRDVVRAEELGCRTRRVAQGRTEGGVQDSPTLAGLLGEAVAPVPGLRMASCRAVFHFSASHVPGQAGAAGAEAEVVRLAKEHMGAATALVDVSSAPRSDACRQVGSDKVDGDAEDCHSHSHGMGGPLAAPHFVSLLVPSGAMDARQVVVITASADRATYTAFSCDV